MKKVLLIASGLSAKQVTDFPYKESGWIIVAISNGWKACESEWDYWVRANDFRGEKPLQLTHQHIVPAYGKSLKKFGGQKECGFSITLNAGYWVLDQLEPNVIGFLGADMNYTPNEGGHTHIYGVGYDIQKNKISDPDRMVRVHGNNSPTYLTEIYERFADIAKQQNCEVVNLSKDIETRLPYPRSLPEMYK